LERSYGILNNNKIYINRSRMDAGSYSKKIVEVVAKNSLLFFKREITGSLSCAKKPEMRN